MIMQTATPIGAGGPLEPYTGGGDLLSAVLADLTAATGGEALFGVLVGGLIVTSFYVGGDRDLATPTVLTIILGSVLIPMLPASYQQLGISLIIVGIAAGIMALANRYILRLGV
jgi:hypothetical protein